MEEDVYVICMNYKAESGRRLKIAMGPLKIRELSKVTGFSISRIGNYLQGKRFMDPDAANLFARVLGVRASWLMVIDDEDSMTPEERALLQKYRQTDVRGKKQIQSTANSQPEVTPPEDDRPTTPPFSTPAKQRRLM